MEADTEAVGLSLARCTVLSRVRFVQGEGDKMTKPRWDNDVAAQDTMALTRAIAEAYPEHCAMDRFGRYVGARNCDPLRKLAVKYQIPVCSTTEEQAGRVARAILKEC